MHVLVAEDEPRLLRLIARVLRESGHVVETAADGAEALDLALGGEYEALVLDVMLPSLDGFEIARQLRQHKIRTAILMLTARDAVEDRVRGLDAGADDYLVKPFDLDELAARVRALVRRAEGRAEPVLRHGAIVLNPATRAATLAGRPVALSAREFALLHALMARPGMVLSRAQLEERLYGWGEEVGSNAVEVHIHNLRRKLGAGTIRNVRGVGYTIAAE